MNGYCIRCVALKTCSDQWTRFGENENLRRNKKNQKLQSMFALDSWEAKKLCGKAQTEEQIERMFLTVCLSHVLGWVPLNNSWILKALFDTRLKFRSKNWTTRGMKSNIMRMANENGISAPDGKRKTTISGGKACYWQCQHDVWIEIKTQKLHADKTHFLSHPSKSHFNFQLTKLTKENSHMKNIEFKFLMAF